MAPVLCDFCSSVKVRWTYHAHDTGPVGELQINGLLHINLSSGGNWAACDPCHDRIETEDWDGLVDRSIAYAPEPMRDMPDLTLRETFHIIHQSFRRCRFGAPQPTG